MNILEFHIGVNLTIQKIASHINDEFLPQEIDYFLNEAVEDFVKEQYSLIKSEGRSIEGQYVNENIRTLIATADITNISVVDHIPNAIKGSLPSEYKYYIFSRTKSNNTWKNNRYLSQKGVKEYLETEYNSPLFREFPALVEGDSLIVIGDYRNVLDVDTEVKLTYIKSPDKIDYMTNPQDEYTSLPSHTHKKIVELAATKMLNIINPRPE